VDAAAAGKGGAGQAEGAALHAGAAGHTPPDDPADGSAEEDGAEKDGVSGGQLLGLPAGGWLDGQVPGVGAAPAFVGCHGKPLGGCVGAPG